MKELIIYVINSSFEASLVILLILVIRRFLFDRIQPVWKYLIWFFVPVRFIIPESFPSNFSIQNIGLYTFKYQILAYDSHKYGAPYLTPKETQSEIPDKINVDTLKSSDGAWVERDDDKLLPQVTGSVTVSEKEKPNTRALYAQSVKDYLPIFGYIWFSGVFSLCCFQFIASYRFKEKIIISSENDAISEIGDIIRECARDLSYTNPISCMICSCSSGPGIMGCFKPRMILPAEIVRSLSDKMLRFILIHEITHLKRGDQLTLNLYKLLVIINWFNPLFWISWRFIKEDCEIACDNEVMSSMRDAERKEYGRTLIYIAEKLSNKSEENCYPSTVLFSGNQISNRIRMITKSSKSTGSRILSISCALIVITLTLTDAKDESRLDGSNVNTGNTNSNDQSDISKSSSITLSKPSPIIVDQRPMDAYFGHASPTTADFDQDGKIDLIVGQSGGGWFKIFRNKGDVGKPLFTGGAHFRVGGDIVVIPSGMPKPEFGDINTDGNMDLICGSASGNIYISLQNANRTYSSLETVSIAVKPGLSDSLGTHLSLDTVDWDMDGDFDIIAGNAEGEIFILNNITRPGGKPTFAKIYSLKIFMEPNIETEDINADKFLVQNYLKFVTPHAVDWNQDGFIDVIFGAQDGNVYIAYGENKGTSRTFTPVELLVDNLRDYSLTNDGNTSKIKVSYSKPTSHDWNSDGILDLIVGDNFDSEKHDTVQTRHGFVSVYYGK